MQMQRFKVFYYISFNDYSFNAKYKELSIRINDGGDELYFIRYKLSNKLVMEPRKALKLSKNTEFCKETIKNIPSRRDKKLPKITKCFILNKGV